MAATLNISPSLADAIDHPKVSFCEVAKLSQKPKIVTVEEAAHYLQVERQTIYRTLKKWTIPGAFRVGRVWRIDLDELERFLGSLDKYPK